MQKGQNLLKITELHSTITILYKADTPFHTKFCSGMLLHILNKLIPGINVHVIYMI